MNQGTNYWAKFEEERCYHIYNRSINRVDLFQSEANYSFFLGKWSTLILPFFDIYAYCLMPNHFHFLAFVKPLKEEIVDKVKEQKTVFSKKFLDNEIQYYEFLEDQFKRCFSSYALAFNKQQGRTGSLFQKRFKRVLIEDEVRLLNLLAYIHHNPIHHNFALDYGHWKFCSFVAYFSNRPTNICKAPILNFFSEDLEEAKQLFMEHHLAFKQLKKEELFDFELEV